MNKTLPLLVTTTFFLFLQIASAQGPSNNWSSGIQGDIFLTLSFAKADEDLSNPVLEQAIDQAKEYLNDSFGRYVIHFYFNTSFTYHGSSDFLWKEWKNQHLPHFKDELTIYVFPAEDSLSESNQYSFSASNNEIALVPYYNQQEFNWFVAKNVAYMLGLDLKQELLNESNWFSKTVELSVIKNLSLEDKILFMVNIYPKNEEISKQKEANNLFTLSEKQISRVRKNIASTPVLQTKLLRFELPENEMVSSNRYETVIADL
jgi:hypothetical protein